MPSLRIMDGSRGVGPKAFGVILACDVPDRYAEQFLANEVEPVFIVFRRRPGGGDAFSAPVRDLSGTEVCLVVNRALQEGKIEFGFRPKDTPPLAAGGLVS